MLRYTLLLFSFSFHIVCFGQTKDEMIKSIADSKKSIETLIKMTSLEIRLESNSKAFDPKDNFNFHEISSSKDKNSLDSTLNRYFSNLYVGGAIMPPYNFISLKKDENELIKILGVDNFYFHDRNNKYPKMTPVKFIFLDKTEQDSKGLFETAETLKEKYGKKEPEGYYSDIDSTKLDDADKYLLTESSSFYQEYKVKTQKPIAAVVMDIEFPIKGSSVQNISNDHKIVQTAHGNIELKGLKDNVLILEIPNDLEKSIQVLALYQDGRRLAEKSSNSNTVFSKEKVDAFQKLLPAYDKALKEIEKGNIKDGEALKSFITKEAKIDVDALETPDKMQKTYRFSGPIATVQLKIEETNSNVFKTQVTYHLKSVENQDYLIATDFNTEKRGLVDTKGNWIVAPKYNAHFRQLNSYFYTDQIDDHDQTYYFNPTTKILQEVAYKIDDTEIYGGKYVKIETKVNGPIGVIDANTGKFLIPMKHGFIHYQDNGTWLARDDESDKEGAYAADGTVLIPLTFDNVKYKTGFFYTKYNPTDFYYTEQVNIYNSQGKNITNNRYNELIDAFSDGLQLVKKHTFDKEKKGTILYSDYYYIDNLGNEKLNFEHEKYHEAFAFSNGLARIEKANNDQYDYDGDFGFIDTKGQVIIPFEYSKCTDFYGTYAYAEKKNGENSWYGFINQKNEKVITLPDGYQSSWFDKDRKTWVIRLHNDDLYDFDGNKIVIEKK